LKKPKDIGFMVSLMTLTLIAYIIVSVLLCQCKAGSEPYGAKVLDTGIYKADGQPRGIFFPNNTGQNMYIHSVDVAYYAAYGTVADMIATLYRASDQSIIVPAGWDHYTSPSSATANHVTRSLEPQCVLIRPGDELVLAYESNAFDVREVAQYPFVIPDVQNTVYIWYTLGSP
jgi:hypothetical protein